jgi:hypothetical protein
MILKGYNNNLRRFFVYNMKKVRSGKCLTSKEAPFLYPTKMDAG